VFKKFSWKEKPVKISVQRLQKQALRELYLHYELSPEVREYPSMVDRIMDVLTFFPDDNQPFLFRVFCPLCGWMSKLTTVAAPDFITSMRGQYINTVCRILGIHLKRKHKIYNSHTRWLAPFVPMTFFKCVRCGYEASSLIEILSHYVHEHYIKNPEEIGVACKDPRITDIQELYAFIQKYEATESLTAQRIYSVKCNICGEAKDFRAVSTLADFGRNHIRKCGKLDISVTVTRKIKIQY